MNCKKCGACCVYYQISVVDSSNLPLVALRENDFSKKVWKEAGKVCEYLEYSQKEQNFRCRIHKSEERPISCGRFSCQGLPEEERKSLEEIARKLKKIY